MRSTKLPTLVLLPGMDGTGMLFAPFLRLLPDEIRPRVIVYPPDRPLDYAGHLELVMAALPTDGPFVLLGESFSGPLALMAAARRPAGLCGVILCATFVTWPLALPRVLVETELALGIFRLKSLRLVQRLLLGTNANHELAQLFFAALDQPTSQVLTARAKAVCRVDCRDALRHCPVPILALVADGDRIIPSRQVALFLAVRPDTLVQRFASPHLILQCKTDEAIGAISRFIFTLPLDHGETI